MTAVAQPAWQSVVDKWAQEVAGATRHEQVWACERMEKEQGPEAAASLRERLGLTPKSEKLSAGLAAAMAAVKTTTSPVQQPLPLRAWYEVQPQGTELERLTYVPGLMGDSTEWIVQGSVRANRMMALGVASVVIGTLIGRKMMGPTESATHM